MNSVHNNIVSFRFYCQLTYKSQVTQSADNHTVLDCRNMVKQCGRTKRAQYSQNYGGTRAQQTISILFQCSHSSGDNRAESVVFMELAAGGASVSAKRTPLRPSLFFTPTARSRRYLPRRMSQKPSCLSASLIKHSVSMSFFRTNCRHLFLLCMPLICHNPPYYLF